MFFPVTLYTAPVDLSVIFSPVFNFGLLLFPIGLVLFPSALMTSVLVILHTVQVYVFIPVCVAVAAFVITPLSH